MRWLLIGLVMLVACQSDAGPTGNGATGDGAFTLESPAFANGAELPVDYTCASHNRSPELRWHGVPDGTQSFVLIVDDPDAPGTTWTHWVLFDIPGETRSLAGGERKVGIAGSNSFGLSSYGGPCPPIGDPAHRYFFRLYALKSPSLGLVLAASRQEVEAALRPQILAQTELIGRFSRSRN